MTARIGRKTPGAVRRPIDRQTMAAVSPLPPSEEVFIDWLMSVPPHACLETAARDQVQIIDRSPYSLHPEVLRLRTLLFAMAGEAANPSG